MSLQPPTKRLGELLVERGLLQPWQVDTALQTQRLTKKFFGEIVVQKGWVTEEALLMTLAAQFGLPYVHLDPEQMDWAVAGRYSPARLEGHDCVAIAMDAKTVTVAITNPLDAWVISELERIAGVRKLRLALAPSKEIRDAIRRCHERAVQSLRRKDQSWR